MMGDQQQQQSALEKFGQDLTARAAELDPVIGRDAEIRRVVRVLCRRTKNNPVLMGEPGVGMWCASCYTDMLAHPPTVHSISNHSPPTHQHRQDCNCRRSCTAHCEERCPIHTRQFPPHLPRHWCTYWYA